MVPGNGNHGSVMRIVHWYHTEQHYPDCGFSDLASFELYEGAWDVRVILHEINKESMAAVKSDRQVGTIHWGTWNLHEEGAGICRVRLEGL